MFKTEIIIMIITFGNFQYHKLFDASCKSHFRISIINFFIHQVLFIAFFKALRILLTLPRTVHENVIFDIHMILKVHSIKRSIDSILLLSELWVQHSQIAEEMHIAYIIQVMWSDWLWRNEDFLSTYFPFQLLWNFMYFSEFLYL